MNEHDPHMRLYAQEQPETEMARSFSPDNLTRHRKLASQPVTPAER
jgi:hypothetical protein